MADDSDNDIAAPVYIQLPCVAALRKKLSEYIKMSADDHKYMVQLANNKVTM